MEMQVDTKSKDLDKKVNVIFMQEVKSIKANRNDGGYIWIF